jgi:hypothetical protein
MLEMARLDRGTEGPTEDPRSRDAVSCQPDARQMVQCWARPVASVSGKNEWRVASGSGGKLDNKFAHMPGGKLVCVSSEHVSV